MNKKNFIQVFEYQKLKFTDDNDFSEAHFDAMVKFNEKRGNKYFTPIYNGIQFNSYVGVIQIGGLTIEILPKADKNFNPDKSLWQNVLLNMLKVCKHIQVDKVSETGLKKKNNSILDVYFEMFLKELENLLQNGLKKKYRRIESNQNALRGKLVFSQNIQKNLVHKEKFYCEHQVYDKDHLIHQILLKALLILDTIANPRLKDKIKRLLFEFENYSKIEVDSTTFEKIVLNRKSKPYSKSLEIAKMIILNYSPNLNSGKQQMLTLLFDMNKLWEEYIYRILKKHNAESHIEISSQSRDYFWEHKTIRPDIVIENTKTDETFIIDTKWKIVDSNNPSDDDLKQMFAYNLHWKAEKSLLLYPKIEQEDSNFGKYYFNPIHNNLKTEKENKSFLFLKNSCKVGFISLIQNRDLIDHDTISRVILKKFK